MSQSIQVSKKFKSQATKAIIFLGFFIIVYILMLILAVGLMLLCIYGGVTLIALKPSLITLALGIGLASLGVLVLFFLLKFIFKSKKVDRSHLYEIKRKDEPQLFSLIDEIVEKVGTHFPKKVYLSPDVNAAVFYDSNFWCMFFPVKKNLQIGLGLVNSINQSELKAILSHEFGHFSQKSMRLGSYVNNINQIVFNLLFENDSYDRLVYKWANISGYFSIFVVIAVKIIEAIQWVLKQLYSVLNKSYMGLSREMEFHADEIAASVTGYEPLKSSLLRLSLSDHSLSSTISFYEEKIIECKIPTNLFQNHFFAMNYIAENDKIRIKNNLPQITIDDLNKFNKSKLYFKDQWASHPTTEERVSLLEKKGKTSPTTNTNPANLLFNNIEIYQQKLTQKIFSKVNYEKECTTVSQENFETEFKDKIKSNSFSEIYNGYYDNKNPLVFDLEKFKVNNDENIHLEDLFSESKIDLVYTQISLQNDIETIRQIANKNLDVRTFDYDGKKYSRKNCYKLIKELDIELQEKVNQVKQNDIKIYRFFKTVENSSSQKNKLEHKYLNFFEFDRDFDRRNKIFTELSQRLQFVQQTIPIEEIKSNFIRIEPLENDLRNEIRKMLSDDNFQDEISENIGESFDLYISRKRRYVGNERYFDHNLEILFNALNNYAYVLSKVYFKIKKELLNYQSNLIEINR